MRVAAFPVGHARHPNENLRNSATSVKAEDVPIFLQGKEDEAIDLEQHFADQCSIDHQDGFDEQLVYVWRGVSKGRLAIVKQMNGGVVKVQFESAIQGSSISFLHAGDILA